MSIYFWYLMVFFPNREQMRLISYKRNICIPDKLMIKDSTDHHLQTIQHIVIWPRGVYSGRHIHTHTWQNSQFGAGYFHSQTGWAGYHPWLFNPNHKKKKTYSRGRRLAFTTTAECTQTFCCSHTSTMPLQSKYNICSSQ